jgi:hypothetical protein
MFRLVPLALFAAAAVGCSKKDNPTPTGDGTDPNATYTIKFRGVEKGDRYEVVKARNATATTKTTRSTQTRKDQFRYEYTETVLGTAPDEPRPTKVTRVYKTADKADAKGQMKPASYAGQTVTIEKDAKGYKSRVGDKPIPPLEQKDISDEITRGNGRADAWQPKSAVKVGEEWPLGIDVITAVAGEPAYKYQKEKSKVAARLVRAYKKDDQQWGEIKVNATIVIDTTDEPGPKVKGQIDYEMTFEIVIDGSARAGSMKMITKSDVGYRDPLDRDVTWTVDGTQEESITPAK